MAASDQLTPNLTSVTMDTQRIIEFISNHWILSSGLFVVSLLLVQDLFESVTRKYKTTTPLGAVSILNGDQSMVLDVREPDEFAKGHIENAQHISLGRLDERMYELEIHKNDPVIVVCQQGTRAASACAKLSKAGFTQIYYLKGGMLAWEDQKLPITTKKKKSP